MRFVGVIIGSFRLLQIYPLLNLISTVIGVSFPMLPSWIQILVCKKMHCYHPNFLISFSYLELYSELCTIEVDLSHLSHTSNVQTIRSGSGMYYKVAYELIMLFGGTEIEVQLCWKENVGFSNITLIGRFWN